MQRRKRNLISARGPVSLLVALLVGTNALKAQESWQWPERAKKRKMLGVIDDQLKEVQPTGPTRVNMWRHTRQL